MYTTRRQLLSSMVGAFCAAAVAAPAMAAKKSFRTSLNVMACGAAGDGNVDDTRAFEWALSQADDVVVPAGVYSVRQISVPAGKRMITHGFATVFRQRPGEQSGTPIVLVLGSNVEIGSFSAEGNIHSDPGEWMPAVCVVANARAGDLSNISIGDVAGKNIRGDVLYLGARPGFKLSRFKIGSISGDNIYRNVVSITGTGSPGGNIRIRSVTGTRVGLFHLDIEPDDVPVVGVSVGSIKGQNVSVSGQSAESWVSSIEFGVLDLSPTYGDVEVANPINNRFVRPHALQLRNSSAVRIDAFSARGFDGQAILFVESNISEMTLWLESCQIQDCSKNNERHAYIVGQQDASKIHIGQLRVSVSAQKSVLLSCNNCHVRSIEGTLGVGAGVLNSSPGARIEFLNISGGGAVLARNTTNAVFCGGSAPMETLAYACDRLQFQDVVATGTFRGGSTAQQHALTRTTLNSVYYEQEVISPLQNPASTPVTKNVRSSERSSVGVPSSLELTPAPRRRKSPSKNLSHISRLNERVNALSD